MFRLAGREYLIEPFEKSRHRRDAFDCGDTEINAYLRKQLSQDMRRNATVGYVLVCPPGRDVLGFYTLSGFSIAIGELSAELQSKMPHYPQLPALMLGRMGVSTELGGQGAGAALVFDAMTKAWELSHQAGFVGLRVQAKSPALGEYYFRLGFEYLGSSATELFIPMSTIRKLIAERSRSS